MLTELIEWHTLDGSKLSPNSVVVDLGANYGRFASKVVDRYGCQVFAVEASPEIFDSLKTISAIKHFNFAIAAERGPVELALSHNSLAATIKEPRSPDCGHARRDETVTVQGMDLESFLTDNGIAHVDLLKVDIEGAEIEMFDACSDETLRNIGQITVEFHDFCDLIEAAEVKRVLSRLEHLGFSSIRMSRVGHQDTWLINQHVHPTPRAKLMLVKYGTRNWRGLNRVVRKAIYGHRWSESYA